MRVRQLLSALIGLLAIPWIATAQSVESQIQSEISRYVAAVNRGDPRAVAALYLNDPRASTAGDGEIYKGWQAIAEVLSDFYSEYDSVQMRVDSVSILPLSPTSAVAVMRFQWLLSAEEVESYAGAMTLVFLKTREGWRVAHDHTSVIDALASDSGVVGEDVSGGPPRPSAALTECVVVRIVDGDTIECARLGRVRLIGMDTPEMNQGSYGAQAAAALAELLALNRTVGLERDVEPRDRYNRVLAYLWRDSVMVNWQLVREGWAVLLTYPPNVRYVDWFTAAQRRAREEKRGLWATGGFACLPADRRRGRCE